MHSQCIRSGRRLARTLASAALAPLLGAVAVAQDVPISLPGAIELGLRQNPKLLAADAASDESAARVDRARASLLPRIDFTESATRSDNPVFVFGSLLNQRRFTEANFALDALNTPNPLNAFQSRLTLEQMLFAGGRNYLELRKARLEGQTVSESRRHAEMSVIFDIIRSYHGIQVAEASLDVVRGAGATAGEDLRRARARFDAGMVTEADMLALEVRLSELKQQEIVARNLSEIRRAELNDTLGQPLDEAYSLVTPLTPASVEARTDLPELEVLALEHNPQMRQTELSLELASLGRQQTKAAFLPTVAVHAGWESDRPSFTGSGGSNWMAGVSVRVNLFNGLGDLARMHEAEASLRQARAHKTEAESRIRLEVRRAFLELDAATERVGVARDAVGRAKESHRITEARYDEGLADVTDLLRSENALLRSEVSHLSAIYGLRLARAALELTTGTLQIDSEAIQP